MASAFCPFATPLSTLSPRSQRPPHLSNIWLLPPPLVSHHQYKIVFRNTQGLLILQRVIWDIGPENSKCAALHGLAPLGFSCPFQVEGHAGHPWALFPGICPGVCPGPGVWAGRWRHRAPIAVTSSWLKKCPAAPFPNYFSFNLSFLLLLLLFCHHRSPSRPRNTQQHHFLCRPQTSPFSTAVHCVMCRSVST